MQFEPSSSLDSTALGHYLVQREQQVYAQAVADVFGFHALQIGWPDDDVLLQSRIPHKHYLHEFTEGPRTSLLCESEFLPFPEASVDLVCLPHVLEQCAQPQQTLREVFRVLVPDGTLVLTGISPLSLLGLRARVGVFQREGHFERLFTAWRIRDWLNVLGFEVMHGGHLLHALPINDANWLARQACMEKWGARSCGVTGGVYYLVAKKRVINLRLLKPSWKRVPLTRALGVRKTGSNLQKQLECRHDKHANSRDLR
ncbi:MAG TPA: class I SAM-dependent methyltransferase [Methylophilus sp.]